ncbi:MAG: IS1380 family transposase [Bacteroidota bacterium]
MLAKLRHINRNVNPYGAIIFCMDEIRNLGIADIIDSHLGRRVKQAKYSYSDTLLAWVYSTLCNSERLEDTKQLQKYFKEIPSTKLPSPDIIAGLFKKLATPSVKYTAKLADHEFNINLPMNNLMVDIALKLNMIDFSKSHVLDYDNVIIPCEKYDSRYSYKKFDGYSPGVAFIGKCPVYIEGRNGNTPAKYKMAETLQRVFDLTNSKGIKIKTFRSDAAAYSTDIVKVLEENDVEFFIRANHNGKMFEDAIALNDWEEIELGYQKCQVTSVDHRYNNQMYRVVITKTPKDNDYKNKYTDDSFIYRGIITNNVSMSDQEVIHFYNQRGSIETNFTQLLNDWSWKRLPFSFMNQNIVFMIVGAIGNLLYQHLIRKFSKKVSFVKPSHRLKNFIFHFITVALEWVIEDNERIPILYSPDRDYSVLLET